MDAFCMLVQFSASCSSSDRLDPWHLKNEALGDEADAMGFRQRDARIEQHVDREGALVEGRQESARQQRRAGTRDCYRNHHRSNDGLLMLESPTQHTRVPPLEYADERTVAVLQSLQM